ncbi:MAG: ParA family protein [Planctomycetota bacterium]
MLITCANQKGGVGKTTTAVHLATGLMRTGARVTLLDLDTQENSILCLCKNLEDPPLASLPGWLRRSSSEGLGLLCPSRSTPSIRHLSGALDSLSDQNFVVLDCPPSLRGWTLGALRLAEHVLVPLQCEFLAIRGLTQVLSVIEEQQRIGRAGLIHVLPVMVEPSKGIHQEVLRELRELLPALGCRTWIPRDAVVSEASSHGLSLFSYRPRAVATRAYAKLVREVRDGWT